MKLYSNINWARTGSVLKPNRLIWPKKPNRYEWYAEKFTIQALQPHTADYNCSPQPDSLLPVFELYRLQFHSCLLLRIRVCKFHGSPHSYRWRKPSNPVATAPVYVYQFNFSLWLISIRFRWTQDDDFGGDFPGTSGARRSGKFHFRCLQPLALNVCFNFCFLISGFCFFSFILFSFYFCVTI